MEQKLESMYSYRYKYLQQDITYFLKQKAENYKIQPKDEENLMSMMHYEGCKCLDNVYQKLDLDDHAVILDAGAGYAGSARYWVNDLNSTHKIG